MTRKHSSVLMRRLDCGSDVASFTFSRPEGYEFQAGQWLRLTLQTGQGVQTKTFSHASAPADPDIEITTRLSGSPFKNALDALEVGQKVEMGGLGGRLRLPDQAGRIAFLVGGVGITPVRSLLRDAVSRGRSFADALVLYGNRDEGCAPYLEEFAAMCASGVRVIPVYERPAAGWVGERGFISAETVKRHVDPGDGRPFVVTGPPLMAEAMVAVLDELGIDEERCIVERFGA